MFLDPAGSVGIQRYDDFAYSKQDKFTKTQRGAIWIPDEVTMTKDKIDFSKADDATKFIFTQNLLRQTALDSVQGRMPVAVFTPVASIPETEAWALWWSAFEQIHSESYSHIVRNIYNMPQEQFNAIHDTSQIMGMLSNVGKYYDELHVLNSKKVLHDIGQTNGNPDVQQFLAVNEYDHVKAIWRALNASYALEAIRFMVSFSTSLGMVENKIFMGSGNVISLILADELLHTDATAWQINVNVKDDPRFKQAKEDCKEEVYEMYMSVIAEEKAWADHIFQKGTVLGLNANIMKAFVDFTAQYRLKDIGVKYDAGVKSTPLPWFNKHTNTNKKQTALQEAESVSYIIGAMTSSIDYDSLPDV
jgi:ribonucleoside-diphosphate reductase beta chain